MIQSNTINIGKAYICMELLFGVLISLANYAEAGKNLRPTMLASLCFDLSKIGVTVLFIQLFNFFVVRNELKSFIKTSFVWLNLIIVTTVTLLSYLICMNVCISIFEQNAKSFPGSKVLSIVFLILFYIIRIGLFSTFMLNFAIFLRGSQGKSTSQSMVTIC